MISKLLFVVSLALLLTGCPDQSTNGWNVCKNPKKVSVPEGGTGVQYLLGVSAILAVAISQRRTP